MHRIPLALFAALSLYAADVNTFSIVAYDPATGDCGVTVASKYFSVGAVVPWAEAGTGCIATQANVNVGYGPRGLELLRQGLTAKQVIDKLLADDTFPGKDGRQLAVIDQPGQRRRLHRPQRAQLGRRPSGQDLVRAGQHPGGRAGARGHGPRLRGHRRAISPRSSSPPSKPATTRAAIRAASNPHPCWSSAKAAAATSITIA